MSISIDKIREEFPIIKSFVYLDHASAGPLPKSTVSKMTEYIKRLTSEMPPAQEMINIVENTRGEIAKLIGSRREEVALTKNTTSGILIALNSIEFEVGDNVILSKDGFPANQYPWHYLLPQVEKRYLDPLKSVPEQLERLIDDKTKAISIDMVDYLTGVKIDLEELKSYLRPNIYLIVDGIQAVGVTQFDIEPVDFMSCGSGKWLLSPHGTGFLYVKKSLLDSLKPTNIGWLSSQWKEFTRIDIKPLKDTAAKYEEGTYNYSGLVGMAESIRMLNSVGIEYISKHVKTLCDQIIKECDKDKFHLVTPENRAGIVTVKPARDGDNIMQILNQAGIVVSLRNNCIRISPHFYNTKDDIEKLIGLLNR